MSDKKMDLLKDLSLWENALLKACDKKRDAKTIKWLSDVKNIEKVISTIEDGTYEWELPSIGKIPKDDGSYREVYILPVLDAVVMSVITDIYTHLYSKRTSEYCVSYKSGISVPNVLRHVRDKMQSGATGYKIDIRKYFDNVSYEHLMGVLLSMSTNSPLDELLIKFYSCNAVIDADGNTIGRYKSLCQGCSFSSLLANVCLTYLDNEISQMCSIYYRYSDDILFIADNPDEVLDKIKSLLAKADLKVHPDKIKKISVDVPFEFLGGRIENGKIHLSDKSMKEFKKIIKNMTSSIKEGNRRSQVNVTRRIIRYLFDGDKSTMSYYYNLCDTKDEIAILEYYTKDCIRAGFAGSWNYTRMNRLTDSEWFINHGWISIINAFDMYKESPMIYRQYVHYMINRPYYSRCRMSVNEESLSLIDKEYLESLWDKARYFQGKSWYAYPYQEGYVNSSKIVSAMEAAKKLETAILCSIWTDVDNFYWQSKKYPELVILRDQCYKQYAE